MAGFHPPTESEKNAEKLRQRNNLGYCFEAIWSQWPGLNRRPTVYETVALPLSYIGFRFKNSYSLCSSSLKLSFEPSMIVPS